jgi:hypothetical protein
MTLKKCEDWNITKKCVRFKLSIEALVEIGMLVVRHSNITYQYITTHICNIRTPKFKHIVPEKKNI